MHEVGLTVRGTGATIDGQVHASDEADVTIYGSGTVAVKATKNLTQKIYGAGKIERSY